MNDDKMNVCCYVESFNFHASTGSKRIQLKGCYRISRSYFQISSFKFNTKYMYLRFLVLWRSQWCDQISSFNVGQKDPTTKCIFFHTAPHNPTFISLSNKANAKLSWSNHSLLLPRMKWIFDHPHWPQFSQNCHKNNLYLFKSPFGDFFCNINLLFSFPFWLHNQNQTPFSNNASCTVHHISSKMRQFFLLII